MTRLILSYLTFPGVIVHEYAHAWACRQFGIRIVKVCYLRWGNPLGYVLHEQPEYAFQHIMVATAPFFVSTFIALVLGLASSLTTLLFSAVGSSDFAIPLAVWLCFSIALHAFPSSGDADALWSDVMSPDIGFIAKVLLVPAVGLIRLSNYCAGIWLDVLYAIIVAALPPLFVSAALM